MGSSDEVNPKPVQFSPLYLVSFLLLHFATFVNKGSRYFKASCLMQNRVRKCDGVDDKIYQFYTINKFEYHIDSMW